MRIPEIVRRADCSKLGTLSSYSWTILMSKPCYGSLGTFQTFFFSPFTYLSNLVVKLLLTQEFQEYH